jgi:hypothetical protein
VQREFITVGDAAELVGFCFNSTREAASKRLKREIAAAESAIRLNTKARHFCRRCRFRWDASAAAPVICQVCSSGDFTDSEDLEQLIPPMAIALQRRIEAGGSIMHGLHAPGGALHVNLGELKQICPHLFPVQWHRGAYELRQLLETVSDRFDQLEGHLSETNERSFRHYEEHRDRIDLSVFFALFRHNDGHERTQTDGIVAMGEKGEIGRSFSVPEQVCNHEPKDRGHGVPDTDSVPDSTEQRRVGT